MKVTEIINQNDDINDKYNLTDLSSTQYSWIICIKPIRELVPHSVTKLSWVLLRSHCTLSRSNNQCAEIINKMLHKFSQRQLFRNSVFPDTSFAFLSWRQLWPVRGNSNLACFSCIASVTPLVKLGHPDSQSHSNSHLCWTWLYVGHIMYSSMSVLYGWWPRLNALVRIANDGNVNQLKW